MVESDTERIERGRALADELNPEHGALSRLRPLHAVAPDFETIFLGSMADLWDRDQLSLRERAIIRLAVLAVLGEESATQSAIGTALHMGLSKEDIAEVFLQTSPQVGIVHVIAALEALATHPDPAQGQRAS
jgi:alkylhydroperoxidase/carboxymuconolactone decarboxylase family protein YurZ